MTNNIFTNEELKLVKELAYKNWENEETEIGFDFNDQWITNPFIESSGRFEFENLDAMCNYYGKENVFALLKKLLQQN